ncbi:odorant receptor 115 [Nasonia vitripennis]|uniref:Odorant receptor n=1 Tax=Nasonia vitripennis TaxID=7425 RepID=A0A7M6UWN1_NASVI|nr:odorant receptor 115 [Nasonia vitripennis]
MHQAIKIANGRIDADGIPNVEGLEKRVFPRTFLLLIVGGMWAPTTIKSRALFACYQLYTVFCFVSVCMLIITILIDNVLSDDKTMESLVEYAYMLIVFSNGLVRIINLVSRRDKILRLLQGNIMLDRWQSLRDDEELAIIAESKVSEKLVLKIWGSLILMNGISNAVNPIIHENPDNTLMFECYSPCDRSVSYCFWMTYSYQLFGYVIMSVAHLGVDCLIYNIIDQINSHYKIFLNRLLKLPARVREKARDDVAAALRYENNYIKECVADHHSIYKAAGELNDIFNELVFIQFISCISLLCTNIYFLSKQELFSPPFIAVFAFLCCALTQNFFFCLFGNKLSQTGSEIAGAIFGMDWQELQKETRRKLLFIMLLTSKGIALFNNAVVNLSPETFLKLVKVSYSAFNLLNQSTHK